MKTGFVKIYTVVRFFLFYVKEIILSNVRVAYDVVTPRHRMQPGVIAIPLDTKTDFEISALANLLTMTPGTLSLDVSSDRRVLYIHVMYMDERAALEKEIKEGFEKKIMEVFR